MIGISRSLIKQFRVLLRRSVLQHHGRNGIQPAVEFLARPNELTLRCQLDGVGLAYSVADAYEAETLRVPANALDDFEGRGQERVRLESTGKDTVLARWEDAGVPHEKTYDAGSAAKSSDFPPLPTRFTNNDPSLLKALHEAMESTDRSHVRFALHTVQLRGTGQIIGTDGRQLLIQTGFQFPWTGDVLVPRVNLFGHELDHDGNVGIAQTGDHICICIGQWTVWLPIDKEGRFPRYENVLPKVGAGTAQVRLHAADVAFLRKTLPHLPREKDEIATATLDLNGQVTVRSRAAKEGRGTEMVLAHSTVIGKPVQYAVNRDHLARALELGFTDLQIVSAETPALWSAEGRIYVCMTLGPSAVTKPSKNDIQLRSDAEPSTHQPETVSRREKPVRQTQRIQQPEPLPHNTGQPAGNGQPPGNNRFQTDSPPQTTSEPESKSGGMDALLEEAEALKEQLRDAYTRAHHLINAAKRYRKQARVVNSTLASLRQLQEVAA